MSEKLHLRAHSGPFRHVPEAVTATGSYRPVSFWQETIDVEPGPPLAEDVQCDVAIVGGGFTGLSTARELKRAAPELDVVLVERSVVGHGASGRNGGFVMPLLGWDLLETARSLDDERARDAYRLMYDAVAYTKQTVTDHQIDCDMEATGYVLLATCRRRLDRLRRELELAHRFGFDHTWLEGDSLDEFVRSDSFLAGVYDPHPAIVNPAKLARGLKRLAEEQGVRIWEQTPLTQIEESDTGVTLATPKAQIRAKSAVLALNGYGGALGLMPARIAPVHTYIVLTEPLDEAQLTEIGWAGRRASLETARRLIHYFRLTADNRIAFGGADVQLYPGDSYRDADESIFRLLEARFREFFPSLAQVNFTHRWGGVLGVTIDMFPSFGTLGARDRIHHATGYSGHGVALANYAGAILAPRILAQLGTAGGQDHPPSAFFVDRRPPWMASGTVRHLGLQAYRLQLRLADWWEGA